MEIIKKDNFHILKTTKYKKALIKFSFAFKYDEVDYDALKLLGLLLGSATAKHNSIASMAQYQSDLYGAGVMFSGKAYGETFAFELTSSFLPERYTEEGNTEKVIKLLSEVLYCPFMKNGKFNQAYFKVIKDRFVNSAIEALQAKEAITVTEYAKLFAGTPFRKSNIIDVKKLKKLNQEDVLKAYKQLLEAPCNIFIGGDVDEEAIIKLVNENFKFAKETKKYNYFYQVDKEIKPVIKKNKRFAQSFLVMLYKTGINRKDKDYLKMVLLAEYLNNRLFKSVREGHGLCYMIHYRPLPFDGASEVLMGIDAKNYRKAVRLTTKEFEKIKAGKIVKKEFKMAKESLLGAMQGSEDALEAQVASLYQYVCLGKYIPLQEDIDEISKYDEKDIVEVGNKLSFLTSYFLKGVGNNE